MTGLFVRLNCSTAVLAAALALSGSAWGQQDDTALPPQATEFPQQTTADNTAEATDAEQDVAVQADDAAQDVAVQADPVRSPDMTERRDDAGAGRGFRSRGFGRPSDESRFADSQPASASDTRGQAPGVPAAAEPAAAEPAAATGGSAATAAPAATGPRAVSEAVTPVGNGATASNGTSGNGTASTLENSRLVFNFAGADWRMTLDWLAEQANLSLQVDRYPAGTVNYIDNSRTYTVAEAMDVLNRLLMDKGFALVRRDRSLMLIDLEADNAAALISEIAELVTPDELDKRANSDIVRCVFSLGSLSAEAARTEITQLIGPAGRVVVLDSTRQVVVSETVNRLKAIRTLLANAATASSDVTEIVLKHRVADELLEIARPLIGLEPGANFNDKIRIAVGLYGDRLWATGDPSARALLQGIIERADTPLQVAAADSGTEQTLPRLETYAVSTAGSSTVIDVLQTLLAGVPDTRIAADPQTGGIIAYARPETHELIQQTIDKLEGRGSTFEIIQLRRLEPSQALLTINKFFGGTAEAGRKDVPTVDGDPVTGRLWVRGTPEQIDLVKGLIERLEGADGVGANDRVRVLPYTGRSAEETVEQLQHLWNVIGRKNRIRMVAPATGGSTSNGNSFPQRRVGGLAPTTSQDTADDRSRALEYPASTPETELQEDNFDPSRQGDASSQEAQHRQPNEQSELSSQSLTLVSETTPVASSPFTNRDSQADVAEEPQAAPDGSGDIVITMTPGGMVVASDDPIALSDFEQMMRTLNEQTAQAGAQPTVFWLKYAKAPEAAELVTRILGGGDSASGGGGDIASSVLGELGGGMLGGLLGLGGGGSSSGSGPILTTTGSVSIVADGRLNALIVQANAIDMLTIEMILEVVDREESPEDVRTTSKPQLIPVIYQSANDVATIVKAVYAERSSEQGGGGRQQQQVSPQDLINALRGGGGGGRGGRGGGGGGSEQTTKPAPVSIAVDTRSNSLIVTAPPQDVEDIRELVEAIDAGGMQSEETVEIVSLKGNVKAEVVQQALNSVLGTQARSTSTTAGSNSGSASNTTPGGGNTPSSADIQRRMEFFQQMRQQGGGGFGGAPRGGFGGGAPGGFRGGGGTGGRGGGGATSNRGGGRGGR